MAGAIESQISTYKKLEAQGSSAIGGISPKIDLVIKGDSSAIRKADQHTLDLKEDTEPG